MGGCGPLLSIQSKVRKEQEVHRTYAENRGGGGNRGFFSCADRYPDPDIFESGLSLSVQALIKYSE